MMVNGLSEMQSWPLAVIRPETSLTTASPQAMAPAGGGWLRSFQAGVVEGLRGLNEAQAGAMQQLGDFIEGKGPALHTVMLSMEQANLNLEFAVQLRNKILDAYTEIMRMQV